MKEFRLDDAEMEIEGEEVALHDVFIEIVIEIEYSTVRSIDISGTAKLESPLHYDDLVDDNGVPRVMDIKISGDGMTFNLLDTVFMKSGNEVDFVAADYKLHVETDQHEDDK